MLVWSWLITSIVVLTYHYTEWQYAWYGLAAVPLFSVAPFVIEIIRWNTTVYQLEVRSKDSYVRKVETKINLGALAQGFPTDGWQTGLRSELRRTRANIFERMIGFTHAWLTVGGRPAFDGERIPIRFIELIESRTPRVLETPDLSESGLAGIIALFDRGVIDADEARSLSYKQMVTDEH
jgi:hypothetical protein